MKVIFSLIFSALFFNTDAQISEGGKPLTMRLFGVNNLDSALQANPNISSINDLSKIQLKAIKTPQVELPAPDLVPIMKEDRDHNKKTDLFREGVVVTADISTENSGKWTTLYDGEKIWRLKIHLPGAKAIGLYYDHFYLPQGAKYFLFNKNGHQVLGAYTYNNNPDDDIWANEKAQGDLINLEIDLPKDVDTSSVHLHINNVADFYRATEYLNRYKSSDAIDMERSNPFPYSGSSPCEINAICPIGAAFPEQRKASIKIEYRSGTSFVAASATLMNNTEQNCTPYVLTASHVDPTNSTSNTTFSDWIFYFNYETPTCTYNGADSSVFFSQTMTGATFKARSSYTDNGLYIIVGDFLLLQLKTSIPISYNAYFSGWDNTGITPSDTCLCFHHPSGDVKKVSSAINVSPDGYFGGEADSHWQLIWANGGIEPGSSGSGLFESNGRFIGDLTGDESVISPVCTATNYSGEEMNGGGEYSKFSLNWLYTYEQPSTPQTRLKDWLDPNNTGDSTLDAIANSEVCIASAGISTPHQPGISVDVYPNPTKGNLFADVHLNKVSNLRIEVYNMVGLKLYEQDVPDVLSGKYNLNLGTEPSGMYMLRISTDDASITEKIISVNP